MAADEAPRFSITDLYIACGVSDKRSTIVERYNVYELIVHWEHGSWCWRNRCIACLGISTSRHPAVYRLLLPFFGK